MLATDLMLRSRWVLRAFMAQHKIKNVELAETMGRHVTTIARIKAEDEIPNIGGEALDDICHAFDAGSSGSRSGNRCEAHRLD